MAGNPGKNVFTEGVVLLGFVHQMLRAMVNASHELSAILAQMLEEVQVLGQASRALSEDIGAFIEGVCVDKRPRQDRRPQCSGRGNK